MSTKKYLDENGVAYLWLKVKGYVSDNTVSELEWSQILNKPTDLVTEDDIKDFVKTSDITAMMTYKGTVATYDDLPTNEDESGPSVKVGDTYNVADTGNNYAWDGTTWDEIGGVMSIETISNSDIDAICGDTSSVESSGIVDIDNAI